MSKLRILVVADDAPMRATLARWLLTAGYAVELAESPRRAREVIADAGISLAIVAPVGLGAAGVELAHDLASQVEHVIVIGEATDAAGAPVEPPIRSDARFSMPLGELDVLAKVRSALSAAPIREAQAGPQLLAFEGFTLDAGGRTCVDANGQEVTLTRAEFSLLLAFGRQPGRVLSRDELTHVVAGRGAEPDDRSVDVLISRLRRKIEPDPKAPRIIVTMPGEGYKFTARPRAVVATSPTMASPPLAVADMGATAADAKALGTEAQESKAQESKTQESKTQETKAPLSHRSRSRALQAALATALIAAVLGWGAWSNRAALRPVAGVTPPTTSPDPRLASTPAQPGPSEEGRRATVFKRMVAAMQDDRFNWRTVERLAIDSGVNEAEAHEILAEHPGEVMIGKARDGKLIARLAER
jgi:two-component system OmpR family response regulator